MERKLTRRGALKVMRGYAAIGLFDSKTEANVGGVLRAASCYDASLVAVQGTRFKQYPTDVLKTWRHIPLVETEDLLSVVPYECIPIAVEIVEVARSLESFPHPERAFYIFGPEDGSLPSSIIQRCQSVVSVPTQFSMNLAATVNVVLYDRLAKQIRQAKVA